MSNNRSLVPDSFGAFSELPDSEHQCQHHAKQHDHRTNTFVYDMSFPEEKSAKQYREKQAHAFYSDNIRHNLQQERGVDHCYPISDVVPHGKNSLVCLQGQVYLLPHL